MATTHVFIVDKNTLKYHIEYMFAGTGAGENVIDFNGNEGTELHFAVENNLVAMIADFQRIRQNDYIIFYVQKDGVKEGKFFGLFKTKEVFPFLDNNNGNQYLRDSLNKSLTFRIEIEPFSVYQFG